MLSAVRELDQQSVALLVAEEEAQLPQVLDLRRDGRLEEAVPDDIDPARAKCRIAPFRSDLATSHAPGAS